MSDIVYVKKRSGELEEYDVSRIENAINKANNSLNSEKEGKITKTKIKEIVKDIDNGIAEAVDNIIDEREKLLKTIDSRLEYINMRIDSYNNGGIVSRIDQYKEEKEQLTKDKEDVENKEICIYIENIQDEVEDALIKFNCIKLAKCYIKYRRDHERYRMRHSELYKSIIMKANAEDVENQNANVDEYSFGGRIGEVTNVIMTELALDVMSEKQRERFFENKIYPHDKNAYFVAMHNCLSIPYDDIVNDYGVDTRNTDIRVSNSCMTTGQLLAVGGQLQSLQQFGGFSATHTDTTFVDSIRKTYNKNIAKIRDVLFFRHPKIYLGENVEPKDVSIMDKVYWGGKFSFLKRYIASKALKWTEKEMYQTCEALYHNLNTLQSRSGNQLPFSSLNYGLNTTPEGRMANESLLHASLDGLGKYHRTSIFPCGILQLKDGVNSNPGDPNYDLKKLALKSTVNRFYPNYFNCDWSVQVNGIKKDRELKRKVISSLSIEMKNDLIEIFKKHPEWAEKINLKLSDNTIVVTDTVNPTEEGSTMGCRTYNGFDINFDEKYFKQLLSEIIKTNSLPKNYLYSAMQKDGRGNIAPSTIIMPTYAIEARMKHEEDKSIDIVEEFMKDLDVAIDETKDFLIERFERICSQKPTSASFMYDNDLMKGYIRKQGIKSALKHGTLAIGQLGLAETLQILIGKNHLTEEGMALAKRIEQLFKDKCDKFKNEYRLNFGVYYTPAENLCYTAMTKFKKKYGNHPYIKKLIKAELLRDYFTNSIHVPVWEKIDPFTKIDIETQLTGYSSAGCILYVELDEVTKNNLEAVEQILDYAKKKDAPYIAFNIPADVCLDCGFIGDFSSNQKCTKCGSDHILMPARITGYLNGDWRISFNKGKQKEKIDRIKHSLYMKDKIFMMKNLKTCGI